jgi:L-threonylcarbamoyladenylate synthase
MYTLSTQIATSHVFAGGVIAYPTEGVFGLGCDPFNADAVGRILRIKKRPVDKGLILIADDIERLLPYLQDLNSAQLTQLQNSWPGPNTWVIPHNGLLPEWVTGGRDTVAVRVSGHPIARQLCTAAQMPIISTSANRSGRPSLTTSLQVRQQLGDDIDFLVGGRVQNPGHASQITDLISGRTFRA